MVLAVALVASWIALFGLGRAYVKQRRRLAAAEESLCDVDNAERHARQIVTAAQFGASRMIEEARILLIKADDHRRARLAEVESLSERFRERAELETMTTVAPPRPAPWEVSH